MSLPIDKVLTTAASTQETLAKVLEMGAKYGLEGVPDHVKNALAAILESETPASRPTVCS